MYPYQQPYAPNAYGAYAPPPHPAFQPPPTWLQPRPPRPNFHSGNRQQLAPRHTGKVRHQQPPRPRNQIRHGVAKNTNHRKIIKTHQKRPLNTPPKRSIPKKSKNDMDTDAPIDDNTGIPKKPCAVLAGEVGPYLPTNKEILTFSETLKKVDVDLKFFINAGDKHNFTLSNIKDEYYCKCVFVKFGMEWFYKISDDVIAKAEANTLTFSDIYETATNLIAEQIRKIKQHHKPTGPVFIITSCGVLTDAVAGTYALLNHCPIVQLDEDGKQKFFEIADDKDKIAKLLAYKIADKIKAYGKMSKPSSGTVIATDKMIDPDSL